MKTIVSTEGYGNRGKQYEYRLERHENDDPRKAATDYVYVVARYHISNLSVPVSHRRFDSRDAAYRAWKKASNL